MWFWVMAKAIFLFFFLSFFWEKVFLLMWVEASQVEALVFGISYYSLSSFVQFESFLFKSVKISKVFWWNKFPLARRDNLWWDDLSLIFCLILTSESLYLAPLSRFRVIFYWYFYYPSGNWNWLFIFWYGMKISYFPFSSTI